MPPSNLLATNAVNLRDQLALGTLSAADLANACIARIEEREPEVGAFAWFDPEHVREQAKRLDELRARGETLGPLHGLPVAVKDIIDTAGIPTENGCPVDAGRCPRTDAVIVERLKNAGAIICGKTVTTQLAFLDPGKTRNPRNPAHTPGGSSSGSAAAVADGMVPLAIGTQTGGSIIRPASFCGITGFKPSFNAITRQGVLTQSHSLDTVGVFANDPGGAALLADVLFDGGAELTRNKNSGLLAAVSAPLAEHPVLASVELPGWERATDTLRTSFAHFLKTLEEAVVEAELPALFGDVAHQRAIINTAEMGHHLARYAGSNASRLAPQTRAAIEDGLAMPATAYIAAKARQDELRSALAPIFSRCDAIICPAAPGPAPEGLESTGDSIFNGLWTMAGTPAITLPLLATPHGLPMGVQLVGPFGSDAKLLSIAQWLWTWSKHNK